MTDYKLMPVEPAADMLGNAMSVCIGFSGDYGTYSCYLSEDAAREVYQAFRAAAPAVQGEPVEFDYPDFHEQGMGCGLEDRNITDRYEAMRYGWDEALERVAENIGSLGPLYTFPQPTEQHPAPDVAGLVLALERINGMDSMSYHSLESAKLVARFALSAHRKQRGEA